MHFSEKELEALKRAELNLLTKKSEEEVVTISGEEFRFRASIPNDFTRLKIFINRAEKYLAGKKRRRPKLWYPITRSGF